MLCFIKTFSLDENVGESFKHKQVSSELPIRARQYILANPLRGGSSNASGDSLYFFQEK